MQLFPYLSYFFFGQPSTVLPPIIYLFVFSNFCFLVNEIVSLDRIVVFFFFFFLIIKLEYINATAMELSWSH